VSKVAGTHLWRLCLPLEEEVDWVLGGECGWVCDILHNEYMVVHEWEGHAESAAAKTRAFTYC